MVSHSNNPMLIQELIKRLPAQYRLDWALCAKRMPNLNLITFSDWLFYMAEAASSVTTIQCSTSNEEKRKPQRVNVHKERPSEGKSKQVLNTVFKCVLCNESGYIIRNCNSFKKLDYELRSEISSAPKIFIDHI